LLWMLPDQLQPVIMPNVLVSDGASD
jgi:hypothetical protein